MDFVKTRQEVQCNGRLYCRQMKAAKKHSSIESSSLKNNFGTKELLDLIYSGHNSSGIVSLGSSIVDSLSHLFTVPLDIRLESQKAMAESDVEKSLSSSFSTELGGKICLKIGMLLYALKHEDACSLGFYFSDLNLK